MTFSSFIKKCNITRDFVLFTLIVIAICYLYSDLIYKAKQKTFEKKKATQKSLEEEVASLSQVLGDVNEKETALTKLRKEHANQKMAKQDLFDKFPDKAEASKMLEEVVSSKEFSGIKFESFYPKNAIPTSFGYYYIPIEVRLSGSFNKIGEYVKYIENLKRIFIIEDINFKTAPDEDILSSCTLNLRGRTYVLNY